MSLQAREEVHCLWQHCTVVCASHAELYWHMCTAHARKQDVVLASDGATVLSCLWKGCNVNLRCSGALPCSIGGHLLTHTKPVYTCRLVKSCGRVFETPNSLVTHCKTAHAGVPFHVVTQTPALGHHAATTPDRSALHWQVLHFIERNAVGISSKPQYAREANAPSPEPNPLQLPTLSVIDQDIATGSRPRQGGAKEEPYLTECVNSQRVTVQDGAKEDRELCGAWDEDEDWSLR